MQSQQARFVCAECGATYLRKEHLNRHQAEHNEARAYVCAECGLSFSRSDSLRRHTRIHNKDSIEPLPRVEKACDLCHSLKTKCDRQNPCAACAKRGLQCTFDRLKNRASRGESIASGAEDKTPQEQGQRKRRRVDHKKPEQNQGQSLNDLADVAAASTGQANPPPQSLTTETSMRKLRVAVRQQEAQIQHDLMNVSDQQQLHGPSHPTLRLSDLFAVSKAFVADQHDGIGSSADAEHWGKEDPNTLMDEIDVKYYVDLYFLHFHFQWPFVIRPFFNAETEPPIIVLAMVMIGLWMTEEARMMKLAWVLHAHLHVIFETQMGNWAVTSSSDKPNASNSWPLATYQAILLFAIFSMTAYEYNYVFSDSSAGYHDNDDILDRIYPIFTHLVCTCRAQGVLNYAAMIAKTRKDDPLVYQFNSLEEFKYFALTLYKVDNMISKLMLLSEDEDGDKDGQAADQDISKSLSKQHSRLSISDLQFPLPVSNYLFEAPGIREFLRRRERQCRDPSTSSHIYGAIMANDQSTFMNRELNPWICDILGHAGAAPSTPSSSTIKNDKQQKRLRRKAWMSLGPWLGYLVGMDPVSVSSGSMR